MFLNFKLNLTYRDLKFEEFFSCKVVEDEKLHLLLLDLSLYYK
jgi:hypothetical protein